MLVIITSGNEKKMNLQTDKDQNYRTNELTRLTYLDISCLSWDKQTLMILSVDGVDGVDNMFDHV